MLHVNNGIRNFIESSKADEYAVDSLDICIIAFEGDKGKIIQPFTNVSKIQFHNLKPGGGTPLGSAVELGVREIDDVLKRYTAQGITVFKPWLIIMSDGKATDDIRRAVKLVQDRLRNRKIKVQCIDMGNGSEKSDLNRFTLDGSVDTISGFKIEDFFSYLSRSAVALSTSTPGEDTRNTIF